MVEIGLLYLAISDKIINAVPKCTEEVGFQRGSNDQQLPFHPQLHKQILNNFLCFLSQQKPFVGRVKKVAPVFPVQLLKSFPVPFPETEKDLMVVLV